MMPDNYITLNIDFTEDELVFLDTYAAYCGEEREALLQRVFHEIVENIKSEMTDEIHEVNMYGE